MERNALLITLATAGGFIGSLYLIMAFILGDYISFTFDKSLMKRLYFQEKDPGTNNIEPETGLKRTDAEELVHRLRNRKQFRFGYFGYLLTRYSATFCCCCKGYFGKGYQYRL